MASKTGSAQQVTALPRTPSVSGGLLQPARPNTPVRGANRSQFRNQLLLATAGCTPPRSRQSAATSHGAVATCAPDRAAVAPQVIAAPKKSAALTCNSRAKPTSVKLPAAIKPIHATVINDDSRDTALLIADARPLRAGSTDDRANDVSGVTVATSPAASIIMPGNTPAAIFTAPADNAIISSPLPANAGPMTRKSPGPTRAATAPTWRANKNDRIGIGSVTSPAAVAECPPTSWM